MSSESPNRMSTARKALMWWFESPGNPYISLTVAYDFTWARAYLAALNADESAPAVTVHHLAAAIIARLLTEFPQANARIIGHRIERVEHVGMAMPVDLMSQAGATQETAMTLVERLEAHTLRELAVEVRRAVTKERAGEALNPFVRLLSDVIDRTPYPLVSGALGVLERVARMEPAARFLYEKLPFTTALSNAGAPFKDQEGVLFRSVSMVIPQKLVHVPTVWGLSTVQDEVLAVDGKPAVRPTLPVVLVFDHRLFDGVMAGRIMVRFGEILRDPAAVLGEHGELRIDGRRDRVTAAAPL